MTTAARHGQTGGYQRRPSRLIYPVAMVLSPFWAVVVIGVAGPPAMPSAKADLAELAAPRSTSRLLLFVPIALLLGDRLDGLARPGDADRRARSITDVAQRLSEPENIATDAVVNVSQAIRREVAAVGDGIERAHRPRERARAARP